MNNSFKVAVDKFSESNCNEMKDLIQMLCRWSEHHLNQEDINYLFETLKNALDAGKILESVILESMFSFAKHAGYQQNNVNTTELLANLMYSNSPWEMYFIACIDIDSPDSKVQKQAIHFLQKASASDHVFALTQLARLYDHGLANPPSKKDKNTEIARLFHRASELGGIRAKVELACKYMNKTLITSIALENYDQEALKHILEAIELGSAAARNHLGVWYLNDAIKPSKGPEHNRKEAAKWFLEASAMGNVSAMYHLATMYQENEVIASAGLEHNLEEAKKWFIQASDLDNVMATVSLAKMYVEGSVKPALGIDKNQELARLYRKAGQLGDGKSLLLLAEMYFNHTLIAEGGVENNFEEEVCLLREASQLGCSSAKIRLACLYIEYRIESPAGLRKNVQEALTLVREAIELADGEAMVFLAGLYETNRVELPEGRSLNECRSQLYRDAYHVGHPTISVAYAQMFLLNQVTIAAEISRLLPIYVEADAKAAQAKLHIAAMYRKGSFPPPSGKTHQQAAATEYTLVMMQKNKAPHEAGIAICQLASMYQKGELPLPKSKNNKYQFILDLLYQALELGSREAAMILLGWDLEHHYMPELYNALGSAIQDEIYIKIIEFGEKGVFCHTKNMPKLLTTMDEKGMQELALHAEDIKKFDAKNKEQLLRTINQKRLDNQLSKAKQAGLVQKLQYPDFPGIGQEIDDLGAGEMYSKNTKSTPKTTNSNSSMKMLWEALDQDHFEEVFKYLTTVQVGDKNDQFYLLEAKYRWKTAEYLQALDSISLIRDQLSDSVVRLKAYCYLQMNQSDQAITLLKTRLEEEPNNKKIHYALGHCYRVSGDIQKAFETFEQLLAKDPINQWGYIGMSYCYQILNQVDDALTQLSHIRDWESNPELCLRAADLYKFGGRCHNALYYYNHAISLNGKHKKTHLALAKYYQETGQSQLAIDTLTAIRKVHPYDVEVLLAIAECRVLSGYPQLALADYRQILVATPNNQHALIGIASCYQAMENYREAIKRYKICLQSGEQKAYLGLADCYIAVNLFNKASRVLFSFPDWHNHLAMLLGLARSYVKAENYVAAEIVYEEASIKFPFSDNMAYEYADFLIEKAGDKASDFLNTCFEQWPYAIKFHLLNIASYDIKRATSLLKSILKEYPFEPLVYVALIKHYVKNHQRNQAELVQKESKKQFVGNNVLLRCIDELIHGRINTLQKEMGNCSPVISSPARDLLACDAVASTGDPSSQALRDDGRAVTGIDLFAKLHFNKNTKPTPDHEQDAYATLVTDKFASIRDSIKSGRGMFDFFSSKDRQQAGRVFFIDNRSPEALLSTIDASIKDHQHPSNFNEDLTNPDFSAEDWRRLVLSSLEFNQYNMALLALEEYINLLPKLDNKAILLQRIADIKDEAVVASNSR